MPDDPSPARVARWTRAGNTERLSPSHPIAVKLEGRHIALFVHEGGILACNNRCPHEGYPLVEGALDAECVLTCHWHNWKFDLRTGAYAAAEAWFRLAAELTDETQRLACASEALAYIAYDTLREPPHPFTTRRAAWDAARFAAAVEAQDEDEAVALVNGAHDGGMHYHDLERALAPAATVAARAAATRPFRRP